MFIEKLNTTHILIMLKQEELAAFKLEQSAISLTNPKTRLLFRQILALAAAKSGVSLRCKTISAEILPYQNGCFLLAEIKPKNERKTYRIKKTDSTYLAAFANAADMLDAVKILYENCAFPLNGSLYRKGKTYYILISSKAEISQNLKLLLNEFGQVTSCGVITINRIKETAVRLYDGNAISSIGKALSKN